MLTLGAFVRRSRVRILRRRGRLRRNVCSIERRRRSFNAGDLIMSPPWQYGGALQPPIILMQNSPSIVNLDRRPDVARRCPRLDCPTELGMRRVPTHCEDSDILHGNMSTGENEGCADHREDTLDL